MGKEASESKVDLIDAVDLTMSKFGFNIRNKIANHFSWQVTILTVFVCVEMCNACTLFIPLENNERLLELLIDGGYAGYGAKYRYILSLMYAILRMNLFFLQIFFVFDKHEWLVTANKQFNQIKSIHISKKIDKTAAKFQFISIIASILLVLFSQTQLIRQSYLNRVERNESIDFVYFYNLIYHFFSLGLQTYFSGAYLSQYTVLTKLCLQFADQQHRQLKLLLKKKNLISSERMMHQLRQFSTLYLLIQNLKTYLKRVYLIFVMCVFGVASMSYYTAFYTDINGVHRFGQSVLCVIYLGIIVELSVTTDGINSKFREMSTTIYDKLIHSLDRKYAKKLQIEVRFVTQNFF